MKPLSIKKDSIKESIVKSQITQKVIENQNIDNTDNLDQLEQLLQLVTTEIGNLEEQKELLSKKIDILRSKHIDDNDDLQLLVDVYDYGSGVFKNIKYTEMSLDNNKKRITIIKRDVQNMQSSPDFKQKFFNLELSCINTCATYTVTYYVDKINFDTNTVMCEHSISV